MLDAYGTGNLCSRTIDYRAEQKRINDAAGRYIEFCKSTFPNDLDLRGMKIVVD